MHMHVQRECGPYGLAAVTDYRVVWGPRIHADAVVFGNHGDPPRKESPAQPQTPEEIFSFVDMDWTHINLGGHVASRFTRKWIESSLWSRFPCTQRDLRG